MPNEDIFIKLSDVKYEALSYEEKNNIDTLISALDSGFVLPKHIPSHFLTEREYAKRILAADGTYLDFMPQFQNDREMVLIAVKSAGVQALKHANQEFLKDYEVGWTAIQEDWTAIKMFPDLIKDKTFCIKGCILAPSIFPYISPELQEDLDVIKPMIAYSDYIPMEHFQIK